MQTDAWQALMYCCRQIELFCKLKVVTLLQDMQKEIETEGETEQKMFDKFMCYCDGNTDGMGKSVEEAEKLTTPIDMPENETQQSLAIQLYAILAQSTQGRGLRAIRAVKTR